MCHTHKVHKMLILSIFKAENNQKIVSSRQN